MDAMFVTTAAESDIARALGLWPELAGRRIRPLMVTAFGDIYVESAEGEVLVADPVELKCSHAAESVTHLEQLFADRSWAQERLMTELLMLAQERGVRREQHQVFAITPHPSFTGALRVENLVAMDLYVWHRICSQLREPP